LADQVERIVSLLHKLESLYANAPAASGAEAEAAGPRPSRGAFDPGDPEDDFLERFSAARRDRPFEAGIARRPEPAGVRSPPPIPRPEAGGGAPDPAFWYKGALRQHEREVSRKPGVLTKIGLAFAAVLAAMLTAPWLIELAGKSDWRQQVAGLPLGGESRPAREAADRAAPPPSPPPETAAAVAPAAPAPDAAPGPGAVLSEPDALAGGQDAGPEAAKGFVSAAVEPEPPAAVAEPPAAGPAPGGDLASKEEEWRVASLQAILDQRAAWAKAKATGDWSAVKNAPPVESRSFGVFESPETANVEAGGGATGSRFAALEGPVAPSGADAADTCESALVESDQTSVRLSLSDSSRAGTQTELAVNDVSYRVLFGEDGRLNLEAPRLDETAVVRWVQRDGSVCQRTLPRVAGPAFVQVAVMWSGDIGLELDVVEPHSWPGSPTGYITAFQPNLDGTHGGGSIRSFGHPGGANRALAYAAPVGAIGDAGVLNIQVKLAPRAEGGGSCGSSAEVFTNAEAPYEVYIVRDAGPGGAFRRENKSFAFNVPPCGATANSQRIERLSIRF